MPLALQLELQPALDVGGEPLRGRIERALAPHGRPLRWAITAVQGDRLQIESVLIAPDQPVDR